MTSVADDALPERVLSTLVAVLEADRGVVMLADRAGATTTIDALGRAGPLSARDRAEISRSVVHEVWKTGQAVLLEADVGEGSASVRALGIACALAAPLRVPGGGAPGGVVYVDFRDVHAEVGEDERQFFELAVDLLALVMRQQRRLASTEDDLRAALDRQAVPPPTLDELLGPRSMAAVRAEIATAVHSDLPLLLLGESGTGKTLLARCVAEASRRTPVIRAMLGAADDLNTITSELFGHERGSFSGAVAARTGTVTFADGGTLILDEILNLPAHAQQLLLDFTQFGTYRPLGWSKPEPRQARVRIIAATNGDIGAAVAGGKFREDLFFRLSGLTVTVPALRRRRDEIPELVEGFLRRFDPDRAWTLTVEARRRLLAPELDWPGNLRQLELGHVDEAAAAIERAASIVGTAEPWSSIFNTLAAVRLAQGDLDGARTQARAAMVLHTADLSGMGSGDRANVHEVLADIELAAGHWRAAEAEARRAITAHEKDRGPESPMLATALSSAAHALAELGDVAGAVALADRAIALGAKQSPLVLARAHLARAHVDWRAGRKADAHAAAAAGRAALAAAGLPDDVRAAREIATWVAAHPAPAWRCT